MKFTNFFLSLVPPFKYEVVQHNDHVLEEKVVYVDLLT